MKSVLLATATIAALAVFGAWTTDPRLLAQAGPAAPGYV